MTSGQAKSWQGVHISDLRSRWEREEVYVFESVTSTNDVARELADNGAPSGSIVICREQVEGRGRDGRDWASPAHAGVYLSMIFRPEGECVEPLVTVLTGVDVANALAMEFPELAPLVKWPNDLMVKGRKFGGILAEASLASSGSLVLILGVGVNVRHAKLPKGLTGAAAVDEFVEKVDPLRVADAIVRGLEQRLPRLPVLLDESVLYEFDRLDWLRNRRVCHQLPDAAPVMGVATGIAPDGVLLLRPDHGALVRVMTGSVEVLPG